VGVADKGIIFSAPMVRGLIREADDPGSGKTNTRRLLWLRGYPGMHDFGPSDTSGYDWHFRRADGCWCDVTDARLRELLPYAPGDRLYVREAFSYDTLDVDRDYTLPPWYWADGNPEAGDWSKPKPSIHMPRIYSRLTLTVTDVRVQRVAEITGIDAKAEGVSVPAHLPQDGADLAWARREFRALWNSLHTKPGERWEDNPWVCAVSFTVRHGNIDRSDR
jgi:hypothetical protein